MTPANNAQGNSLTTITAQFTRLNTRLVTLRAPKTPSEGDVPFTRGRMQHAQPCLCTSNTAADDVSFTCTDRSAGTIPVAAGPSYVSGVFTNINSIGTTAIATYANLR